MPKTEKKEANFRETVSRLRDTGEEMLHLADILTNQDGRQLSIHEKELLKIANLRYLSELLNDIKFLYLANRREGVDRVFGKIVDLLAI